MDFGMTRQIRSEIKRERERVGGFSEQKNYYGEKDHLSALVCVSRDPGET